MVMRVGSSVPLDFAFVIARGFGETGRRQNQGRLCRCKFGSERGAPSGHSCPSLGRLNFLQAVWAGEHWARDLEYWVGQECPTHINNGDFYAPMICCADAPICFFSSRR